MNAKIALISVGFLKFRFDIAQEYLEQTPTKLGWTDVTLKVFPKVIIDEGPLEALSTFLKQNAFDGVILQIGTFPMGELMLRIVEMIGPCPILLWGFEDPIMPDHHTIPLNSLTGLNMLSSYMHRLEHPYDYVYGAFEDTTVFARVATFKEAIKIKRTLETSKFGIIGSRAPGFYLCEVNQLQFRKDVGPLVEYYAVGEIIERAKALDEETVEAYAKTFRKRVQMVFNEAQFDKTVRLYLALKAFVKEHKLTALSIKCWPEWQTLYGVSVCPVLALLNDDDIMTSCEGDVSALATMVMAHAVNHEPPFLADLATIHSEQTLKAWHCGHVPTKLCSLPVSLTEHPTMKEGMGLAVQGDLKLSDDVTLFKLSETPKEYRLFLTTGASKTPDRSLEGPQTDVVLDRDVKRVLDAIVYEGIEHHYVVALHAMSDILVMLSRLKGWRVIQP